MRFFGSTLLCLALIAGLGGFASLGTGQDGAPSQDHGHGDRELGQLLLQGLEDLEGCLGYETATTDSGKTAIFAWFQDLDSALDWYYSDAHQGAINHLVGEEYEPVHEEPMQYLDDDIGPILTIASLTPSKSHEVEGIDMPISQISIELYQPLPGGVAMNGKFAPDALKVPHLHEFKNGEQSKPIQGSGR